MTYTYPHDLSNSLFSCRWLPNANRFQCFLQTVLIDEKAVKLAYKLDFFV